MCCFLFLRLVLLLYLHFVAEATQIGEITDFGIYTRGADELDSNDRIAKLEAHNRHQDKEIYFLKNTVEEERKISHQLRDRVAKLEESNDPHKIIRRPKRPVRLLPPHILRGENNQTFEQPRHFYGPATGCNDLGRLGYTLNGYYLVNEKDNQSPSSKYNRIEVVQCRFKKPPGETQTDDDKEKRLGFISITKNTNENTCLYQLKNYQNACLVATDRKKSDGSNQYLGSVLRMLPCESLTEENEQWTRKGLHICSSKNNKCFTFSTDMKQQNGFVLNLMAYEESATNQQWVMNAIEHRRRGLSPIIQIVPFDTNNQFCWHDPANDFANNKMYGASKTKPLVVVQPCTKSLQQQFFFDPIIEANQDKNCTVEYASNNGKSNTKNKT